MEVIAHEETDCDSGPSGSGSSFRLKYFSNDTCEDMLAAHVSKQSTIIFIAENISPDIFLLIYGSDENILMVNYSGTMVFNKSLTCK